MNEKTVASPKLEGPAPIENTHDKGGVIDGSEYEVNQ